jgi:hypothetical protein
MQFVFNLIITLQLLGSIRHPFKITWTFSPDTKSPERELTHQSPFTVEVKNERICISATTIRLYGVGRNDAVFLFLRQIILRQRHKEQSLYFRTLGK